LGNRCRARSTGAVGGAEGQLLRLASNAARAAAEIRQRGRLPLVSFLENHAHKIANKFSTNDRGRSRHRSSSPQPVDVHSLRRRMISCRAACRRRDRKTACLIESELEATRILRSEVLAHQSLAAMHVDIAQHSEVPLRKT
jgi:hypothetical protein